ncbi:hypothetical protein RSOLAG1IB_12104 [Rhizoctonia solani AG-1 IB]|uniref:Uncharacterized protein n=1 Tax=Thanatephorus cucumeris (strain AG1-IB / isolate 7/3/14) TaxID=1108050 RepID=A0A0B7FM45_THACB|nr:hypothetical protein RSOLAG1IB_12104 [Rhizoctonia solani AG-1 IB]
MQKLYKPSVTEQGSFNHPHAPGRNLLNYENPCSVPRFNADYDSVRCKPYFCNSHRKLHLQANRGRVGLHRILPISASSLDPLSYDLPIVSNSV